MDAFELLLGVVAAKPAKLQALFVQFSDQKQVAMARHQAHQAACLQLQCKRHASGTQQQQEQQQHQVAPHGLLSASPMPAAVPPCALHSVLAYLLASGHVPDAPGATSPCCVLREPDLQQVLAVLVLDSAVQGTSPGSSQSSSQAQSAQISKTMFLTRLKSARWAARRAAALHRSAFS